jgi:branched-chain amino acid transport system permease protein
MGISLVIQNTAVEIFGGYPQRFPRLVPDTRLGFGNFGVDLSLAFNLLIAGVVIATFYHVIKHTRLGLRMRALSDNLQLARSMGVSTTRDQYAAVVISSSLAGLAAIMVSQAIGLVSPFVGAYYGLKGLVAVLVGGLGRMGGAVVVALLLGLGEAFAASVASNYRDAITFGLMVVFILVRGAAASSEAS